MPVYAFGTNEHHQVDQRAPLHLTTPYRIDNSSKILAASWSQAVISDAKGVQRIQGLPLEPLSFQLSSVKTWLGQDEFVAALLNDGSIQRLSDGAISETKYSLASMNSRGEVIAVPEGHPTTSRFFPTLNAIFNQSSSDSANEATDLSIPFYPSTSSAPEHISSIVAGASHFLILASPSSRLFSLGDNRYGQLGVSQAQTSVSSTSSQPTLHRIDAFDGIKITQISAGAFHSVVLTEGGQVYFFGSDQKGQCGGTGGGSEPSLNDTLEGEQEDQENGQAEGEEENEIVQVCAFGESTILRNRGGEIWVAGANHSGQLGLGSTEETISTFVKYPGFGSAEGNNTTPIGKVVNVLCGRWTAYLDVEEP